jgi:nicotinamide-nucleotide amidase
MKATIINIGDELLIGQVVNTNASWMAHKLNRHGLAVDQILAIGDTKEAIFRALDKSIPDSTVVLITGGLGPTKDDITKLALAEYFGTELEFHQASFDNIKQLFAQYDRVVDDQYEHQATMPVGARILINRTGTASGMWFEQKGKHIIAMPGVPREVRFLMKYEILPKLILELDTPTILHRTISLTGKGETHLSALLEDFEKGLPSNIKLAYLPEPVIGTIRLRLTAIGNDAIVLETQLEHHVRKLIPLLGTMVFGEGKDTLESVIGRLLKEKNYTLGTAESCTGGMIAHKITSVAGSSAYFESSVVSYSNESKVNLLGVKPATLVDYGAVSEACVCEMAKGAQQLLGVNCAIAVSGVAGPTGGSPEKPVGTIWIAIAVDDQIHTQKVQLGKERMQNIEQTSTIALNLLRRFLIDDL